MNDETYDIEEVEKINNDAKSELEADSHADANNDKMTEEFLSQKKLDLDKAECEKVVEGFRGSEMPPHIRNSEIIKYALLTLIDNGSCG